MSLTEIEFKPVSEEDLESVMALEVSIPDSPMWASATKEEQRGIIVNGNMFGIYENGMLVGKVGFWNSPDDGWEVDGMVIRRDYQNRHLGTQLFDYAVQRILEKETPAFLILYTHPQNTHAICMYLKAGFTITDLVRNKYGQGKDRLKMKKILSV